MSSIHTLLKLLFIPLCDHHINTSTLTSVESIFSRGGYTEEAENHLGIIDGST